jgi:hypothetical protein
MAKVDSPTKYVVILQTPQYGTITWGPFRDRQAAQDWIANGGHKNEMWAAYETDRPSGMVLFANPLYIPEDV